MNKYLTIIYILVFFQKCSIPSNNKSFNLGIKYLERVDDTTLVIGERIKANSKAVEIFSKSNDSVYRSKLYKTAQNFYYLNDNRSFYKSLKILDKNSILAGDLKMEANAKQCFGIYFQQKLMLDSAYKYFVKAKKNFANLGDKKNLAFVNLDLATIQYDIGDYMGCEKSIFETLSNLKYKNDDYKIKLYSAYTLLGNVYCDLHEYDKSLEYQLRGLTIIKNLKKIPTELHLQSTSYNNIGNIYKDVGQYEIAATYFNKALLEKNIKANFPALHATSMDNLAYCNFKINGAHKSSYNLLLAASKLREENKIVRGQIISMVHLSEYFAKSKDSSTALKYIDRAIELSTSKMNSLELLGSLKFAIELNHINKQDYIKSYIRINDSIQLAERRMRNKFARIAYETDEIIVEKDNAIKHKWIILGASASALLLIILLFIIRLQRAKQVELLLKQQQQEANENIYQLIHDQQFHVDAARRDEKKRISQELHDGVMNQLTSTRLNLFVLNKRKDEETIEKCLSLINGIQNIEREIRQVAHDLNSDVFAASNSFNSLLESLFQEQKLIASANIHTQIDQQIDWEGLDSATKMNLYRITQEALSNCHKYAQANNIFLTIDKPEDTIHIVINDDGIGFDMKKQIKGIGLKNMRERIKTIGGTIDILSEKGKGTTIIVNLAPNNQLPTTHGKKNQYYNC